MAPRARADTWRRSAWRGTRPAGALAVFAMAGHSGVGKVAAATWKTTKAAERRPQNRQYCAARP